MNHLRLIGRAFVKEVIDTYQASSLTNEALRHDWWTGRVSQEDVESFHENYIAQISLPSSRRIIISDRWWEEPVKCTFPHHSVSDSSSIKWIFTDIRPV